MQYSYIKHKNIFLSSHIKKTQFTYQWNLKKNEINAIDLSSNIIFNSKCWMAKHDLFLLLQIPKETKIKGKNKSGYGIKSSLRQCSILSSEFLSCLISLDANQEFCQPHSFLVCVTLKNKIKINRDVKIMLEF